MKVTNRNYEIEHEYYDVLMQLQAFDICILRHIGFGNLLKQSDLIRRMYSKLADRKKEIEKSYKTVNLKKEYRSSATGDLLQ